MTDTQFPTGWIPDEFDPRDRPLYMAASGTSSRVASTPSPAPSAAPSAGPGKTVSLRAKCPPIYNQMPLGSCSANAVAAALRYAVVKAYGQSYEKFNPSRLFIYHNGRRWGADYGNSLTTEVTDAKNPTYIIQHDDGAYLRKTLDALRMVGACDEKYWPYPDPKQELADAMLFPAPNDTWYNALTYIPRVVNYYRIVQPETWHRVIDPQAPKTEDLSNRAMEPPPVAELQRCIDDGFPFIFGLYFYFAANFNDDSHFDDDGVFRPPPTSPVNNTGGHAVLAIGYDSAKRLFLIQNSWGTAEFPFQSWTNRKLKDEKMRGYCWMPYEWFEPAAWTYPAGKMKGRTAFFTSDFWVIKVAEGVPLDKVPLDGKGAPRARAAGEPWPFIPTRA